MVHSDIDASTLHRIRNAYVDLSKGGTVSDEILHEVQLILHDESRFCPNTRKLAAQLSIKAKGRNPFDGIEGGVDWVTVAAVLDETKDVNCLGKICLRWIGCFKRRGISDSTEEFLFLTCLVQRCQKHRKELETLLQKEIFDDLIRCLRAVAVILYESRTEDLTHLIKAVIQMSESYEENFLYFRGLLELESARFALSLLIPNIPKGSLELEVGQIPSLLVSWCGSQDEANSASTLVSSLLAVGWSSAIDVLYQCLVSYDSNLRTNVVRCWLSRYTAHKYSANVLDALLRRIKVRISNVSEDPMDVIWPPRLWETEDYSCIDPRWQWTEGEDVWWYRDRLMNAFCALKTLQAKKSSDKHGFTLGSDDWQIVESCLKWHRSEVRMAAFKLLLLIQGDEKELSIDEFLVANASASSEDVRSLVKAFGNNRHFSSNELEAQFVALTIQSSKGEDVKRSECFLPSGTTSESVDFGGLHDYKLLDYVENLLITQGSSSTELNCPSFPVVYTRLDAAGLETRSFAQSIVDAQSAIIRRDSLSRFERFGLIMSTVTRCRLKAVVDHGCDLLDDFVDPLLDTDTSLIDDYFMKAISLLSNESTTARTLSISRLLWTLCAAKPQLFQKLWYSVVEPVLAEKERPSVLSRVLKTLKLFAAKANSELPLAAYVRLFAFCIDVQTSKDFLVRSSATILYGFVVRRLFGLRQMPLFVLVTKHSGIWNELSTRICKSEQLNRLQRVLLLSVLRRISMHDASLYTEQQLRQVDCVRTSVLELLLNSRDVRERRFTIDSLLSLADATRIAEMRSWLKETTPNSLLEVADMEYLAARIDRRPTTKESRDDTVLMPTDLLVSPFVQRIEIVERQTEKWKARIDEQEFREILTELDLHNVDYEDELELNCQAMILNRVARAVGSRGLSSSDRSLYDKLCRRILDGDSARAHSVLAWCPVYFGLTDGLLHRWYLKEIFTIWKKEI